MREATVVSWLNFEVFFTREFLFKIKKASSPICLACEDNISESTEHLIIFCSFYKQIREHFLKELLQTNTYLNNISLSATELCILLLDPLSEHLPAGVRDGWQSVSYAYQIGRNLCYKIYTKREKFYNNNI